MSEQLTQLAQRRVRLQRRAAEQRQQLGALLAPINARIHAIDHGFLKVRSFVKKPLVLAAATAVAFALGPRRALRLAGKAMFLISAVRRLRGLLG